MLCNRRVRSSCLHSLCAVRHRRRGLPVHLEAPPHRRVAPTALRPPLHGLRPVAAGSADTTARFPTSLGAVTSAPCGRSNDAVPHLLTLSRALAQFDADRMIDLLQALEKFVAVKDYGDGSAFKVQREYP
eukprot:scaffold243383_cov27-Tisochrysis_lutea.AAC.2